jgi:hypothetical protein
LQAPGPRGSPQLPQDIGPDALDACVELNLPLTAKTDSCFSRSVPTHVGHDAARDAVTMASNLASQSRQMYS